MKFTFDAIRANYKKSLKFSESFPQIEQSLNGQLEWDDIVDMSLSYYSGVCHKFHKISKSNLDIVLGNVKIDFDTIKPMLIKYSNKCLEVGKKRAGEDWATTDDEVIKLQKVCDIVKKITKSEFDDYFSTTDKYYVLFPDLYRIEINLYTYMANELINYIISNKVECFDDMCEVYQMEYYTDQNYPSIKETQKVVDEFESTNELVSKIMDVIYSTDKQVNIETFRKRIKKSINGIDVEKMNRNIKLKSIIN
jgi:hypothetical protein